jgi:hypothetical protein
VEPSINEELKSRLIRALDAIESGVHETGEFAKQEAPLVAREIATVGVVKGIGVGSAGLLVTVFALVVICKKMPTQMKRMTDINDDDGFFVGLSAFISSIFTVPLAIVVAHGSCSMLSDGITALVAPRLYVIEYVAKLIK